MADNTIDELVGTLFDMIEDARSMPLMGDKCLVDREKALDILDEVRANLPADLRMAKEIVGKRNEMLNAGQREVENMKKQAEDYAKQRLNDHEMVVEARRRATEIINEAEKRSREVMRAAGEYCDNAIKGAEEAVGAALDEVKRSRAQFKSVLKDISKG